MLKSLNWWVQTKLSNQFELRCGVLLILVSFLSLCNLFFTFCASGTTKVPLCCKNVLNDSKVMKVLISSYIIDERHWQFSLEVLRK